MVTEELTDKKLWNQEKAEINQMIDKIYQPPTYQPAEEFYQQPTDPYQTPYQPSNQSTKNGLRPNYYPNNYAPTNQFNRPTVQQQPITPSIQPVTVQPAFTRPIDRPVRPIFRPLQETILSNEPTTRPTREPIAFNQPTNQPVRRPNYPSVTTYRPVPALVSTVRF